MPRDQPAALTLLKRAARFILRRPQPPVVRTHPFDTLHGVDSSGLIDHRKLHTGHSHDEFSTAYFGVPPSRFRNAIEQWQQTPETALPETVRFIDIGAGKGRAVLLASRMGFRDVIGIELHAGLAATAQQNLEHWRATVDPASPASILNDDAVAALPSLLQDPVLLYLYNPFRPPVLRALLSAIGRALPTGQIDLLYLYPEHDEVFADFPDFHPLWRRNIPIDPEDAADGLSHPTDPCSLYRWQTSRTPSPTPA